LVVGGVLGLAALLPVLLIVIFSPDPRPTETNGQNNMLGPALRLQPVQAVALEAGQSRRVAVQLVRQNLTGPVELSLKGLPAGVTAKPVTVAAGSNAAELELTADAAAAGAGLAKVRLVATAGDVQAEGELAITVRVKEITNSIGMRLVLIPAGK